MEKSGEMSAWSLKNRIILMALAPSLFISLLLGSYLLYSRINDLQEFIVERGKATTHQLATISREALEQQSSPIKQELVNATLEESGVRSVIIYDANGEALATGGPKMIPPLKPELPHLDKQLSLRETANTMRFTRPVFTDNLSAENPNGQSQAHIIGWIEVEYAYSGFTIKTYQTILISSVLVLLAVITTGALAVRVNHSATQSLGKLTQGIRQLRKGDLNTRIDIEEGGDIGGLARELNQLIEALQRNLEDMEVNVEQTTNDLRETMETIEIQNIELDLARREALEASRIKSEFLANTSHEIRTPLNGIMGFTNLLLNTDVTPRQRDYLSTIRESSENLLTIINDILDFSKIEAGKLVLEHISVNIRDLLEDVLNIMARNAHDKGLELSLIVHADVPELISGDPLRIKQILTNLVSNAIKFTEKGYVVVRVRHDGTTNGRASLTFSVSDSGIGLKPGQQRQLFKPFNQADSSTSREFGGTGLGLVICKRLIDQMNGDIGVEAESGKGATFWFTLHASLPEQFADQEGYDQLEGKTFAVIEPNSTSAMAVGQLLESWQCIVNEYPNLDQYRKLDSTSSAAIVALEDEQLIEEDISKLARELFEKTALPTVFCYHPTHDQPSDLAEAGEYYVLLPKPLRRKRLYDALQMLEGDGSATELQAWSQGAGEHKPRVLAVDDNPANLKLLLIILDELGAEGVPADSGLEALRLSEKQVFDLIFMDIQMPEIDGVETTRRLRTATNNPNRNTPIIALTAHALAEEKRKLLDAGMNDHVAKPIDHALLKKALATWCMNFQPGKGQLSEANTGPANNPQKHLVDLQLCLKRANEHSELAQEMLESLLNNLHESQQEIDKAFHQQDWESLLEAVHKLHGATCYTGVPELGSILRKLETAVKQQKQQDIRYLLPQLAQVIKELIRWQEEHDLAILFE